MPTERRVGTWTTHGLLSRRLLGVCAVESVKLVRRHGEGWRAPGKYMIIMMDSCQHCFPVSLVFLFRSVSEVCARFIVGNVLWIITVVGNSLWTGSVSTYQVQYRPTNKKQVV